MKKDTQSLSILRYIKHDYDDKKFFTSQEFIEQTNNLAKMITGRYRNNENYFTIKVIVFWNKNDGNVACTDNNKIYINAGSDLLDGLKKNERCMAIWGLLAHELGHCLFTDFTVQVNALTDKFDYSALSSEAYDFYENHKAVFFNILKNIMNIVEDPYEENRMKINYPGSFKKGITYITSILQKSLKEKFEKDECDLFTYLLAIARDCLPEDEYVNHPCLVDCEKCFDRLYLTPYPSMKERVNLSLQIFSYVYDEFIKKDNMDDEEMENEVENMENNNSNCSSSDSKNQNSKGMCNQQDSQENSDSNESNQQKQNDSEQNNSSNRDNNQESKNSQDSSSNNSNVTDNNATDNSNNESSNSNSSKSEEKSEDNNDEKSNGTDVNGDKVDNDDKNNSQSQNKQSGNTAESNNNEQCNDESDSNSSDKSEATSKSSANDSSNQNSQSNDNITGMDDTSNNNEGPQYEKGEDDIQDVKSNPNDIVEAVAKALSKDDEVLSDYTSHIIEQEITNTDYHHNVNCTITKVKNGSQTAYNSYMSQLKPIAKKAQNKIVDAVLFKRKSLQKKRQPNGCRLDINAYVGRRKDEDTNIFITSKKPNKKPQIAISVIVDESGSMSGEKQTSAIMSTMVLESICRNLNIPLSVIGHDVSSCVRIREYIDFDGSKAERYNLTKIRACGCNRDGFAIRYAFSKLKKRNEPFKLLIIISDGLPSAYGFNQACADISDIRKECRKKNTELLAFAIGDDFDRLQQLYGKENIVDCRNLNTFPKVFSKIIADKCKAAYR